MTMPDIQRQLAEALSAVAPEIDPSTVRPDAPLRDQVDLDSMDFLRLVVELHKRVGVDIPEADYGKLQSLRSITEYLQSRLLR